jgi:hypothetical protein
VSARRFNEGNRVYHWSLEMSGVYQGKHNWGELESSSYVLFDGDGEYPDGRPVTTDMLVPEAEVSR